VFWKLGSVACKIYSDGAVTVNISDSVPETWFGSVQDTRLAHQLLERPYVPDHVCLKSMYIYNRLVKGLTALRLFAFVWCISGLIASSLFLK
jgi:hypothetical protein